MTTQLRDPTSDRTRNGTITVPYPNAWAYVAGYPDQPPANVLGFGSNGVYWTGNFTPFSLPAGATQITLFIDYYDTKNFSQSAAFCARLNIGTAGYNAATHVPQLNTYVQRTDTFATNPATGAAWTVADINGAGSNPLTGFGLAGPTCRAWVYISAVRARVEYTPPAQALVSFAELTTPDGGARGRLSFAELTTPDPPARRAAVSFAELTTPDATSRALLSFAELTTPDLAARALLCFAELAARNPHARHNPNVPDIIPENVPRMLPISDAPFAITDAGFPNSPPAPVAFHVGGTIGQTIFQLTRQLQPNGLQAPGKVVQRRRHFIPADPRSTSQLQLRARFGRAVQAWRALTPPEKSAYNARGARQSPAVEGLNVWVRDFCRAHPKEEFAADAEHLRLYGHLPTQP